MKTTNVDLNICFAKGLGTSSENLERLLLYNIIFIQLSEQNGKVTRLIFITVKKVVVSIFWFSTRAKWAVNNITSKKVNV